MSIQSIRNLLKENNQEEQENEISTDFKHWLALRSCTEYKILQSGCELAYIDSEYHPTKVDFMFNKKIKLLVGSISTILGNRKYDCNNRVEDVILVTEDVEKYDWSTMIHDKDEDEIEDVAENENEAEDEVENEAEDEVENEAEDEVENEAEGEIESHIEGEVEDKDEVEDEANKEVENETDEDEDEEFDDEDINTNFSETYAKKFLYSMSYSSHKIDWSNTRVIKTANNEQNFLALTDDGKIYYATKYDPIRQIDINEKITCIGCGVNFFVIVTDNGKTYSWGEKKYGEYLETSKLEYNFHTDNFLEELREVVKLSGKTIVKVVCGAEHTLALTDKGELYTWGANCYEQSDFDRKKFDHSSTTVNINKLSDIAAIYNMSAIKYTTDGFVYIWGALAGLQIQKSIVCEHTNVIDICNSMMAHSPVSMVRIYIDEEYNILNALETAFNDCSTSDLTIKIKEESIYVHKAILKIRSRYFRTMFQSNCVESNQSVIKPYYYSYVIYKTFLKYLYTGTINLSSIEDLLDLLKLADEYCEHNLERDCIKTIKKEINISNVFFINETAIQYNKMELEEYSFHFFLKNYTNVIQAESFMQLDIDTKIRFITKANNFFTSCF